MFFQSAKRRDRHDDDRRRVRASSEGKALHWPRPSVRPWLPASARAADVEEAETVGPGRAARDLRAGIGTAAFAFRGYDQTNLGRSPELLAHPIYGPIVRGVLDEASQISTRTLGRPIDLAARIESHGATTLDSFAEDIATIVAMELAQLAILERVFEVPVRG
jgi:hypothetical protein